MKRRRGKALDVIAAIGRTDDSDMLDPMLELEEILTRYARAAGAWSEWQGSDGIPTLRVLESDSDHARVCGRTWEISKQTLHTFWLDVTRETWTLYFDIDPESTSPRRARQAAELINDPSEVAWSFSQSGSSDA